jgi:hypothetical protein
MLTETIITDEESLIDSFKDTSNYKKVVTSRKTEFSSIRAEGKTDNEIMLLK